MSSVYVWVYVCLLCMYAWMCVCMSSVYGCLSLIHSLMAPVQFIPGAMQDVAKQTILGKFQDFKKINTQKSVVFPYDLKRNEVSTYYNIKNNKLLRASFLKR